MHPHARLFVKSISTGLRLSNSRANSNAQVDNQADLLQRRPADWLAKVGALSAQVRADQATGNTETSYHRLPTKGGWEFSSKRLSAIGGGHIACDFVEQHFHVKRFGQHLGCSLGQVDLWTQAGGHHNHRQIGKPFPAQVT